MLVIVWITTLEIIYIRFQYVAAHLISQFFSLCVINKALLPSHVTFPVFLGSSERGQTIELQNIQLVIEQVGSFCHSNRSERKPVSWLEVKKKRHEVREMFFLCLFLLLSFLVMSLKIKFTMFFLFSGQLNCVYPFWDQIVGAHSKTESITKKICKKVQNSNAQMLHKNRIPISKFKFALLYIPFVTPTNLNKKKKSQNISLIFHLHWW